ncbi:hypothetical protein WQ56_00005, partial [Luteimonas sp. FCS-9]
RPVPPPDACGVDLPRARGRCRESITIASAIPTSSRAGEVQQFLPFDKADPLGALPPARGR